MGTEFEDDEQFNDVCYNLDPTVTNHVLWDTFYNTLKSEMNCNNDEYTRSSEPETIKLTAEMLTELNVLYENFKRPIENALPNADDQYTVDLRELRTEVHKSHNKMDISETEFDIIF